MVSTALLVVDVQKDFVEGGSLEVAGGLAVAYGVHDYIHSDEGQRHRKRLASKDWHNREGNNGGHFHADPDYKDTWPGHCIAGTTGSEFAGNLDGLLFDDVFHKGWDEPAYDAFQGISVRNHVSSPDGYLSIYSINHLYICGIASTHCVLATVLTALAKGYRVSVIERLTAGVGGEGPHNAAIDKMRTMGAEIV